MITGLVALSLVSAIIASLLTTAVLVRGPFDDHTLLSRFSAAEAWLSAATNPAYDLSESGGSAISPSVSAAPSPWVSAAPSPFVSAVPSPAASATTELPAATVDPAAPATTETEGVPDRVNTQAPNEETTENRQSNGSEHVIGLPRPTEHYREPSFPAGPADEQFQLWQEQSLIEDLYASIRPSVAGINVVVDETVTSLRRTNEGSGLIMSEEGYIVTNSSLISIAVNRQGQILSHADIHVYIDGFPRALSAELIGRDPLTGLAVIKINPGSRSLQPAPIAISPELKVGQMILAVGYPDILEESGSLYTGLISSLNRPVQLEDGTSLQMIQTDARVSQRCSGGPVLNLSGEVIGIINFSLAYQSYEAQNYALSAETAQRVVEDMTSRGFVAGRSWLGVSVLVEETFDQLRGLYNYPDGFYVTHVIEGSPAYIANMRKGDIITAVNDEPVTSSMDISHFLQSQPVGSLINLLVYRSSDRQYHEIRVYLQEYTR